MPGFERGAVVRVPFPYTDRATRQHRPALVISDGGVGHDQALLWVAMITSAENRSWPGDVELIDDFRGYGLPAASRVRTAKIATIDATSASPLGQLSDALMEEVDAQISRQLGFAR